MCGLRVGRIGHSVVDVHEQGDGRDAEPGIPVLDRVIIGLHGVRRTCDHAEPTMAGVPVTSVR